MTPKQMNSEHRSFYAEEDGAIHGDDAEGRGHGFADRKMNVE